MVTVAACGFFALHRTSWTPRGAGFPRANPLLSVSGETPESGTVGGLLHGKAATLHVNGGCDTGGPAQLSLELSPGKQLGRDGREKGFP